MHHNTLPLALSDNFLEAAVTPQGEQLALLSETEVAPLFEEPRDWTTIAAIGHAATEKTELQNELRTDQLTGLLNARGLQEVIEALPANKSHYAIFLDVNKFKPVNDTLGHDNADLLLKEVARFLSAFSTRENAEFARRSGDEFTGIIPTNSADERGNEHAGGVFIEDDMRTEDTDAIAMVQRIGREWTAFIGDYDGPYKDLVDRACAVGFGITVGIAYIPPGASYEEVNTALGDADKKMEFTKLIDSVANMTDSKAKALLSIQRQIDKLGIDPRELTRQTEAAIIYLQVIKGLGK